MKKIIPMFFVAAIVLTFSSCGPHMYKSQSSGKDDVSFVIILQESRDYDNVSLVIDDIPYTYGRVYKVKAKRKAHPVIVQPGKHNIKVIVDGTVKTDENVFLGLQETKMIVLR